MVQNLDDLLGYINPDGEVDSSILHIPTPEGAAYESDGTGNTGAMKITLPQYYTDGTSTLCMELLIWFGPGKLTRVFIGGKINSVTSTWDNPIAYVLSDQNFSVRFGDDGSKCCIWVGETTTEWGWGRAKVLNFCSDTGTVDDWNDGWDITIAASLGTVKSTISNADIFHAKLQTVGGTSATDGQALVWDNTNGFWEPGTVESANITVSTSSPSGGSDGDIWFKVSA